MATATEKRKAGINIGDVLGSAKKTETKTKSKTPVLEDLSEGSIQLATQIREKAEIKESLESEIKSLESILLEEVSPARADLCKRGYVSTVKVPCLIPITNPKNTKLLAEIAGLQAQIESAKNKLELAEGESISFSWKDQYSKIPLDNKEEIEELTGDSFDYYFKPVIKITVKEEATSQEMLMELISAVGEDHFKDYFQVEQYLEPTSRYTQEQFLAFSEDKRKALSALVRQYKPSLKTK